MECGISNKTANTLLINVNGREYTVESDDGVYVDIPEESSVEIKVQLAETDKKITDYILSFFLSPVILFRQSEILEIKEKVALPCDFAVAADESIVLTDAEDSFAACDIVASNRLYTGIMNYTKEELKKQIKDFFLRSALLILGSVFYLFVISFFIKDAMKPVYFAALSAAAVLPAAWIAFNTYKQYDVLKKRTDGQTPEE